MTSNPRVTSRWRTKRGGRTLLLGAALLVALVIGGASAAVLWTSGGGSNSLTPEQRALVAPLGDIPDETARLYVEASQRHDLFAHLPCYCGCAMLEPAHTSLDTCFFQPSGDVEAHATGCRVCTDIARDAVRMADDGRTHAEIRAYVDEAYGDVGVGTETPLP